MADIDIISIVDNVESTKNSYEKLLRKFESNADKVLSLPTLKSMIKEIESNEDGEVVYQGQKLKYYSREIQFLKNHGAEIIKSIIFIRKLLLTILLVMVTQYFLMPAVFLMPPFKVDMLTSYGMPIIILLVVFMQSIFKRHTQEVFQSSEGCEDRDKIETIK